MQPDVFGDLDKWNGVLAKLDEIASRKSLDEHQVGLARILRFKQNRGLVHAALGYAKTIEKASDILIAEVLNVLVSEDIPLETRTLAAGVLGHLIPNRHADSVSDFDLDRVVESMSYVLSRSRSPLLKKTLDEAISRARERRRKRSGSRDRWSS